MKERTETTATGRLYAAHMAAHLALPILANFLAVLFIRLFYHTFLPDENHLWGISDIERHVPLITQLQLWPPFLVALAVMVWYMQPVSGMLRRRVPPERWGDVPRRRLLGSPLVLGLVSVLGWTIAYAMPPLYFAVLGLPLTMQVLVVSFLNSMVMAIFCLTVTYFSVELINRTFFMPRLFPDGRLSETRGALRLSLAVKLVIYFISVSLLPVSLYEMLILIYASTDARPNMATVIVFSAILVAIGALVTVLVLRALSGPLHELTVAARRIRQGDYRATVGVRTIDELGMLGETMNEMSRGLALAAETEARNRALEMQKALLEEEIRLARQIQQSLLPRAVPALGTAAVAFKYMPMSAVGGDLVDVLHLHDRGCLGLFICDVSGHGIPAALTASMVKMALAGWHETIDRPAATLAMLARSLSGKLGGNFITAAVASLELATGALRLARAGHPPFLVLRASGEVQYHAPRGRCISELTPAGFDEELLVLERGDRLVLYTDGVTEARQGDELLGEAALASMARTLVGEPAGAFCEGVYEAVIRFADERRLDDDFTIMAVDRL